MYCTYCGVQNTDDANFCLNCGKELSHSPTEEVVESRTDESQSEVRVHHPWMPVQQQPQEQVRVHHPWMSAQKQPQEQVHNEPLEESQEQAQEQIQDEPLEESQEQPQEQVHNEPPEESQEQAQGEVPNALKSILRRVKGWSKKKKILAGIVLFFLFITCVGVIFGEPVEETGSSTTSLKPPKVLVENIGGEGAIHEGHWHDADKKCRENDTDHPEFSEDRFNEVIDAATASSENLGLSMPSGAKLTELQSVFDGTVSSSDIWVDAFWANQKLVSTLNKGIDDITLKKFGSYRTRDGTLIWVEWRDNDDGSPEWATARSYWDNRRALLHWFNCGTAKIN